MRRLFVIPAVIIAAIAATVGAGWVFLFHTPPGRNLLEELVERELGAALNSESDIGTLGGSLPGEAVLRDIVLMDGDTPWLTVDELRLRWRPFALINKRIMIDQATITGANLIGEPPRSADTGEARRFKIFDSAPRLTIDDLVIDDFTADVEGVSRRIDGNGAVSLDGAEIAMRLNLESEDGADKADIVFDKSPRSGQFKLDAVVNGAPGGALTALLGLEGPLALRAAGDSPINDAVFSIDGTIGYYGDVAATIATDLDGFNGADVQARLIPGARLEGIEELAGPVAIDARYDAKDRGGLLAINTLTSALGEISGHLAWQAPRGFVQSLDASLTAQLAPDYRVELQEIAGNEIKLDGKLNWRRNDYSMEANISGPLASIKVRNGATDLRRAISGVIGFTASSRDEGAFWLLNGLTVEAALRADLDSEIHLTQARATTGDGSRFTGAAGYNVADESVTAKGDIAFTPAFGNLLFPDATLAGELTGDIDLSGPLERFTLTAALELPSLQFEKGALPPMNIEAALSGLPRLPTGAISAQASNGAPRRLSAELRSSEDGTIRIPTLSYGGRGFTLDGGAQINPDRQTLTLDLTYLGADNAEPWPGFVITGDLGAKGVLSRDGALNQMTATAGGLQVNGVSVDTAELVAEGPPGAIRAKFSSDLLTTEAIGVIADLSASGQIDARAAPKLSLNAFSAVIRDSRAQLSEPAQFDFADGLAVRNLRLAYGEKGAIAFDGAMTTTRWRGDLDLVNVNIPDADGQISASLVLDTDAATPAQGDVHLRSLLLREEDQASIHGRIVWDGEFLRLTDQDNGGALDMDIRLPAKLIRSPQIAIDAGGALSGRLAYDGELEALAVYLPPVLQSVEGALSADFSVSGSLQEPALEGRATITGGAYTEIETGFALAGLHAEARASYRDRASTLTFSGGARGAKQSREDTLTFSGDLKLGEDAAISLTAKLDEAEFAAHPINQVRASGELTVTGPPDALVARGDIAIAELDAEIVTPETTGLVDIDVIAINDAETSPNAQDARNGSGLDFAIRLHADDRIFIRGRGLESDWSADVNALSGREGPLIIGRLTLRRGWLDFSGRRFDLTRGSVDFDRIVENDPRLDIRAEHQTSDGVTAIITVTGRASAPDVALTSSPSLPSEDVMSLILFGKPAQTLSPFESLQTAEALASLSGVGPFGGEGVTGRLRRTVGLDLLNVDIDPENGGGSLTVGKYVADGFFVSASQDAQGKTGTVRVKYEITDNITVETELEQEGDQTVSANWKKDF